MSQSNEIDGVIAQASGVVTALLNASAQLATALIELRVQRLRQVAERDQAQARQVRERMRAHHQGDAAVWRAAMRPQWWRQAGAEDISRVWRAASTWQHVDPRAAEARQVVVDRLAERGVRVDLAAPSAPSPQDVGWLSDALDQAAADRAAAATVERDAAGAAVQRDDNQDGPTVIDGEAGEVDPARPRRTSAADREQQAAAHVRSAWPEERAERVIGCKAWGVLANQLDQLQQQGHHVEALLRGVTDFVDQAHTPAAFAYRSIDDRLDGLIDLGTQSRPDPAKDQAVQDPFGEAAPAPVEAAGRQLAGGAERASFAPAGYAEPRQAGSQNGVAGATVSGAGALDQDQAQPLGAGADAGSGDGQAAQIAAQAYPISTRYVVAGAAEKMKPGTVAGGRSVVSQPTREEPVAR